MGLKFSMFFGPRLYDISDCIIKIKLRYVIVKG